MARKLLCMLAVFFVSTSGIAYASQAYAVQVGSFSKKGNAENVRDYLESEGIDCRLFEKNSGFKVLCGEFARMADARKLKDAVAELCFKDSFLVSPSSWGQGTAPRGVGGNGLLLAKDFRGLYSLQAGSFSRRKYADIAVLDLGKKGVDCWVVKKNGLFKVYCGEFRTQSETRPLKRKLASCGYRDAFPVPYVAGAAEEPSPPEAVPPSSPVDLKVVTGNAETDSASKVEEKRPAAVTPETVLPPSYRRGISADVLGRKRGHFHPRFSLLEIYSDNIFKTRDNKVSDYETIVSAGLALTVPGTRKSFSLDDISAAVPAGQRFNRPLGSDRIYQALVFLNADLERFRDNPDGDFNHYNAGAVLQVTPGGHLSLGLSDRFLTSHDERGTGLPGELYEYNVNLGSAFVSYNFGKLKLRADYSNFNVDYKKAFTDFKDRNDNKYAGYIYYNFNSRTSAFLEYESISIDYDEDILPDSVERDYFGGLEWDITAKSTGLVKAGYGVREFNGTAIEDVGEFVVVGSIRQVFTPKTSLILTFSRGREESDIQISSSVLSNSFKANYLQRISHRISFNVVADYIDRRYEPAITFGGVTKVREDKIYKGSLAVRYEFKRWLSADLGYAYNARESNFPDFEYTGNRAFLSVSTTF